MFLKTKVEAQQKKLEMRGEQSFRFNEVRTCKRSARDAQQMCSLHAGGAADAQFAHRRCSWAATNVQFACKRCSGMK